MLGIWGEAQGRYSRGNAKSPLAGSGFLGPLGLPSGSSLGLPSGSSLGLPWVFGIHDCLPKKTGKIQDHRTTEKQHYRQALSQEIAVGGAWRSVH